MAITTRDQLIAAIAASSHQYFMKIGGTAPALNFFQAQWRTSGTPAAAAAGPANGSNATYTSASQGAISLPAPSNTSYLASFEACCNVAGTLILTDRVADWGVSAAVNTAQAMASVTLPTRATAWTDMQLWFEVETALGATQTGNIAINYTDQDGNAGSTALGQFAASAPIGRAMPVSLASGDKGVRNLTQVQLTTASTGKFNAVLRKHLAQLNIAGVGATGTLGWPETALGQIGDNACLELIWLPQTTTSPNIMGGLHVAQG
jgi:hypothetical protein